MAKILLSELFDEFLEIKGGIESTSIQEIYEEFKNWAEKTHSILIGSYMTFYVNALKKCNWQKKRFKKTIKRKYEGLDGAIKTNSKLTTFYSFAK